MQVTAAKILHVGAELSCQPAMGVEMLGVVSFTKLTSAWQAAAILPLLLVLVGCASFSLDRYDSSIETDANAYHIKVAAFVAAAEKDAGTPAGLSTSDKAKVFYSEQGAVLANMVVRAEAANAGGACPLNVAKLLLPMVEEIPESTETTLVSPYDSRPASCTVLILRHLHLTHLALESIHADEGYLRPPVSTETLSAINDAVRIVLRHEHEKKS